MFFAFFPCRFMISHAINAPRRRCVFFIVGSECHIRFAMRNGNITTPETHHLAIIYISVGCGMPGKKKRVKMR